MVERLRELARFARTALELERVTEAGRVNAWWMILGFVMLTGSTLANLVQVVVRIWNEDYTTGSPNLIALFAIYGGFGLLCVLILGLIDLGKERSK